LPFAFAFAAAVAFALALPLALAFALAFAVALALALTVALALAFAPEIERASAPRLNPPQKLSTPKPPQHLLPQEHSYGAPVPPNPIQLKTGTKKAPATSRGFFDAEYAKTKG
jgi:hypothetical protein